MVTPATLATLPAAGRDAAIKYSSRDESGHLILLWDHARCINHSCAWATLTAGVHLFDRSLQDIAAGQEITEDYALLNPLPEETFACHCGSARCRGHVGLDDVTTNGGEWARALHRALSLVEKVAQPLQPLLREEYVEEARAHCRALEGAVSAPHRVLARAADLKKQSRPRARR